MLTHASRRLSQSPTRHLATRPPLRRLFWAVNQLRSGRPPKATDLAREFETSVRTAYRDLDFLRDDWRVPVEFDRAQGSYRLTEPMTALPPVTMSQGELLALYFAEKVVAQYRGTPFEADIQSAFRKLQEMLPESGRRGAPPPARHDQGNRCPYCGSQSVAQILRGLPAWSPELEQDLAAGRLVLGGCIVSGDHPDLRCNECGQAWRREPPTRRNRATVLRGKR